MEIPYQFNHDLCRARSSKSTYVQQINPSLGEERVMFQYMNLDDKKDKS
jgi:hypothetical protein